MTYELMNNPGGYFRREQVLKMLGSADNQTEKLIINFLWETGCRVSEMLLVKKKDIQFKENFIYTKNLKRKKTDKKGNPIEPKKEWKTVPVSDNLALLLFEYTKGMRPNDNIFALSRFQVYRIVLRLAKSIGINAVGIKERHPHPHCFRHGMAIDWLNSGGDTTKLCEVLGHSKLEVTQMYMSYSPADLVKIQQKRALG